MLTIKFSVQPIAGDCQNEFTQRLQWVAREYGYNEGYQTVKEPANETEPYTYSMPGYAAQFCSSGGSK